MSSVEKLIEHYGLQTHPEGGWYQQVYKSNEIIPADALPARFNGERPFSTAIYFLLEKGNFSAFHRIKSDECWHFYAGDPLIVYMIAQNGKLESIILGHDFENGQRFQFVVPANTWFASRPTEKSDYSFVGCTVAPGFDFADFEMATREELIRSYPEHKKLIVELTR